MLLLDLKIFYGKDTAILGTPRTRQGQCTPLTHRPTPLGAGTMLHRAICGTISGRPTRGVTWTAGVYVKACAADRAALARWLEANGAPPSRDCGLCLAKGRR